MTESAAPLLVVVFFVIVCAGLSSASSGSSSSNSNPSMAPSLATVDGKDIVVSAQENVHFKFSSGTVKEADVQDMVKKLKFMEAEIASLTSGLAQCNQDRAAMGQRIEKDIAALSERVDEKIEANRATQESTSAKVNDMMPFVEHLKKESNLVIGSSFEKSADLARWSTRPKMIRPVLFQTNQIIRASVAREEAHKSCYNNWGVTNRFPIDPKAFYEFSIWVKASSNSDMAHYFGFYVYDSKGSQIR